MAHNRAYLAGFGTGAALVACAALVFVLASALVAFNGLPGDGAPLSPVTAIVGSAPSSASTPAATRLAAYAAAGLHAPGGLGAGAPTRRSGALRRGPGPSPTPVTGGRGVAVTSSPVGSTRGTGAPGAGAPGAPVPGGSLLGRVTGTAGQTVQGVSGTTGSLISSAGQTVGSTITNVAGAVSAPVSSVSPVVGRSVAGAGSRVGQTVTGAGGTAGAAVSGVGGVAGTTISHLGDVAGG